MRSKLLDFERTNKEIMESIAKNYILCAKDNKPDEMIRVHSIMLYDLIGLRLCHDTKTVECYDPKCGKVVKTWELNPLLEFDDLSDEIAENVIVEYLKSSTMQEMAIDDLRHMKFNVNGLIKRGYDEE